ncbi:hypothetical protein A9Q79_01650 [Methylophaga sp. 42_25_T18]|nr:hypothetical protein A9Q79_01650 [Methylophaga sp. 42_25_T18]
MTPTILLMMAIFILGAGALIGFFKTKTKGFGRFTTSVFLILLVIIIAALLYAGGKLEGQVMANVLFAVFGFAGGLFTSKDGNEAGK